ncbi:Transcription factor IIIB 90 kDa subunit [Chlorella sorokiniana]|uniref:Transcription factor IIIB 90 kDa subunit n=1 Tax=Chlorella sorokiniana TaxID=3076 RepID=A0A2P6TQC3_CHLSO|nr:Transcription factor IIIB 90 kDa subunit [Chlorella sorokiniana]|eukprot:PRW56236.1 Transcription factor IIIB 90 kDa subunit [Chlorella sorokiniana]
MSDVVCGKCGADAVEFDVLAGVSACQECGAVQAEELLVHGQQFDEGSGEAVGTRYVAAADTGERAAALALAPSGTGLAIQRRQSNSQGKLKGRVREYCALLRLQPPVIDQALHVLEQAIPSLMGNWRRDLLAASAAYAACRLNSLPLTLADLSVSTQIEARQLGRHYTALCRLLALQPPLLLAADLLPRSCDRVTSELVQQGKLSAEVAATLRKDAVMLVDWMQAQLERKQYPLATVGAAIVLAAEMNTVTLSLDHVSSSLQLMRRTLDRKLSQARQRLVQLAGFLPYAASINTRNVGSHARTIIKLSALVGSTEEEQGG